MPAFGLEGGFLPRPAVEVHHRNFAAEDAAGRHHGDRRDAVGARDRDRVALGVIRDARAELRVQVEHLVDVVEPARRPARSSPICRARVDEARDRRRRPPRR